MYRSEMWLLCLQALMIFLAVLAVFWGAYTMLVAAECQGGLVYFNPMAYCVGAPEREQ